MSVIEIEDFADPRIAEYRNLRDADLRAAGDRFMVEGRGNLACLIERSAHRAVSLLLKPGVFEAMRGELSRLPSSTPIYLAKRPVLDEIVGFAFHRGCLAVCERDGIRTPGDLLSTLSAAAGPLVVLEGLTNHDNVGGVFRNAMAFAASGVLLCPRCCDPLYRKAIRTSMGGSLCVPFARARSWPDELAALARAGVRLVALDPGGDDLSATAPELLSAPDRPIALLLGTEGAGVSAEALELVDLRWRIEMAEGIDSLNVATASGIALHHLYDRLHRAGPRSGG